MKKIIIFLIIFLGIFIIHPKDIYASTSFYQAEYVPNIYLNKYNPQDNLIYYHPAQIIRDTLTKKLAYCLEPFTNLNNNNDFTITETPQKYSESQLETISLIAYFGYGYKHHTDMKWYAITQTLIWKTVHPTATYYYTSTAKGEKIYFWSEEQEIYNLIEEYKKNTSFNNNTYTIVAGNTFEQTDYNGVLNTYTTSNSTISISNNTIKTPKLEKGKYEFTIKKILSEYNVPILFYLSDNNQDVMTIGMPLQKTNRFWINVVETSTQINKLDYDTNQKTPQGDAAIDGTILSLYTDKNTYIKDILINENEQIIIKNLNFGNYYLIEKQPGIGYNLNEEKHHFTINENNTDNTINIKNKVIKGKLIIKKEYGSENDFKPEPNISFNIYNSKNNLVKTITTNELGIAEIILPYGKYTLNQLTTTEGYQKIKPIKFEIKNNNEIIIKELKNYKIEVPNTYTQSILSIIINYIKELLW